jgi:hypothetical protein
MMAASPRAGCAKIRVLHSPLDRDENVVRGAEEDRRDDAREEFSRCDGDSAQGRREQSAAGDRSEA